jgi:hypothetical protein
MVGERPHPEVEIERTDMSKHRAATEATFRKLLSDVKDRQGDFYELFEIEPDEEVEDAATRVNRAWAELTVFLADELCRIAPELLPGSGGGVNPWHVAEMPWWREHRDATERIRLATVDEQVEMLTRTGVIVDAVRLVRISDWYATEGQMVLLLRMEPA